MYFQGVSTRNVREVLESMCASEVSAATVSRVAAELDEKLSAFRARRLDHTAWPYLKIDARYEKVRVDGRVVSQAVLRRAEEMAAKWQASHPAVASMLRDGLEDCLADCLAVLSFPAEHRRRLTSTNLLENLMRRLKKRTRVVGVFPNRASCDRLIGALLLEVHEGWQVEEHRFYNMELAG